MPKLSWEQKRFLRDHVEYCKFSDIRAVPRSAGMLGISEWYQLRRMKDHDSLLEDIDDYLEKILDTDKKNNRI